MAAGDIEVASLNEVGCRSGLCVEPSPSTSPRLWWDKSVGTLKKIKIGYKGTVLNLEQHHLDSCLFLLFSEEKEVRGLLAFHADNIIISAQPDIRHKMEEAISGTLPINRWEDASDGLEYCGVSIKQSSNEISLSQEHYVNTMLHTVDIPKS